MRIELIKNMYFRMPIILRLLIAVFIIMIAFGTVIHFVEPTEFTTIFDGVWWAFVTGATVGYGDFVPQTTIGKIIGILLILSGGGLLTFYITTVSTATFKHENNLSKGRVNYKGNNQIIIIGWNERTRQLIDMIHAMNRHTEIVLIDNSLQHFPYQEIPVHFIHGDASEDGTLLKANVEVAKSILITADTSRKEKVADHHTILTTVAIRGNNQSVPVTAEILSDKQLDNALRAGATTIVRPNDLLSSLLYHELFFAKKGNPSELIANLLENQEFVKKQLPARLENKSFKEALAAFSDEQQLLLGVIRKGEWKLNPAPDFLLKSGDVALSLSAWDK